MKPYHSAVTWMASVGLARPARVWCSAWDCVCRLSAGPASAANTHPQTSRASASVLPAAVPTARLRPGIRLMPPSLPASVFPEHAGDAPPAQPPGLAGQHGQGEEQDDRGGQAERERVRLELHRGRSCR